MKEILEYKCGGVFLYLWSCLLPLCVLKTLTLNSERINPPTKHPHIKTSKEQKVALSWIT